MPPLDPSTKLRVSGPPPGDGGLDPAPTEGRDERYEDQHSEYGEQTPVNDAVEERVDNSSSQDYEQRDCEYEERGPEEGPRPGAGDWGL